MGSQRNEGASAVEFALVLPILVLFLFGILSFGILYFDWQGIQAGAREAARVFAVTNDPDAAELAGRAALPPTIRDDVVFDFDGTASCESRGTLITVEARISDPDYGFRIPLGPSALTDLSSQATFACERISG